MPACLRGRKVWRLFVYSSSLPESWYEPALPDPVQKSVRILLGFDLFFVVFFFFHLTFKLYLLGKPVISKPKWFGHVRINAKTLNLALIDISLEHWLVLVLARL